MERSVFMDYRDIQRDTNLSKSKCYEVIREINKKLNDSGIKTFKGRVLTSAYKQYFGIDKTFEGFNNESL